MNNTWTTNNNRSFRSAIQLRAFPLHTVCPPEPIDEPQLRDWQLRDIRALAIDPDEQVVLNLLSQVDPHAEANHFILNGPHTLARRELARRNLATSSLLTLVDDSDEMVRTSARTTLERRGVLTISGGR